MDVARSRQPQDGQFSVTIGNSNIDIRVATTNTIYGERITLRLLDKSLSLFTLPELGLLPEILKKYRSLIKYPFGMILVGGPTGSGKTTTLYTSINELDHKKRNIMTIEDPVEYQFEDISQSQVDPKAGITFASGLRAMLRQDPDVILVGEIRDKDTAVTAVQAAMTGHLVFSSIHANDAVSMLPRLIDLGVEPSLVATILIANVAQRMVRRICPNCRTAFVPSALEQEIFSREMSQELTAVYKGTGCHLCANTGYRGRTGIFEMLIISDGIKKLLVKHASFSELKEHGRPRRDADHETRWADQGQGRHHHAGRSHAQPFRHSASEGLRPVKEQRCTSTKPIHWIKRLSKAPSMPRARTWPRNTCARPGTITSSR